MLGDLGIATAIGLHRSPLAADGVVDDHGNLCECSGTAEGCGVVQLAIVAED
jgi:hypothetical protein